MGFFIDLNFIIMMLVIRNEEGRIEVEKDFKKVIITIDTDHGAPQMALNEAELRDLIGGLLHLQTRIKGGKHE